MKTDFRKMEEEMELLSGNMAAITDFHGKITDTLADKRARIDKLSSVHTLLKKLQYLFELPSRLNKCMEMGAYGQAVRYYTKAQTVLDRYQELPSFQGIRDECQELMRQLSATLWMQFADEADAKRLADLVDLLLQLGEPPENLRRNFLGNSRRKLDASLGRTGTSNSIDFCGVGGTCFWVRNLLF